MAFATRGATTCRQLFALPLRAADGVRRHGLRPAARRARLGLYGTLLEWRLGVQTRGSIEGRRLGHGPRSYGYQPIPYDSFDAVQRHLPVDPGKDVFVDYGCGLGRAVVLAARLPFRKVIGLELSSQLCALARANVDRSRAHHRCVDVQIVNADATAYQLPDDASVLFLFNPFDVPIVRLVLDHVRRSLRRRARPLRIVYALPKSSRDVMAAQPWLRVQHDLSTSDRPWQRLVIYEAEPCWNPARSDIDAARATH